MTTYMKSTFDGSRPLPQAIALRDEHIVFGPFCVHCGAPQGEHSLNGNCPRAVSPLYPLPACTCHGLPPICACSHAQHHHETKGPRHGPGPCTICGCANYEEAPREHRAIASRRRN